MEIKGGQRRYELIDYLKGFSILTIVVMHLLQSYPIPSYLYKVSSLGGTGVHTFFFCSGFGLCLSQCKKELTYFEFIKKRLIKIYLPYIVIVMIIALIPFTFEGSITERFTAVLSHVFLFKMFVPALEGSFSYPLWYISTLFQFYFIFIGLYKIKKKIGKRNFLIVCLLISIFWWFFTSAIGIASERIWGSFFLQYLWEFALGMCIADKLYNGEKIKINITSLMLTAFFGLTIGGFLGVKGGMLKNFNDFFIAFGYIAFAVLVYNFVEPYKKICCKVSTFSYELYLVHPTCFLIVIQLFKTDGVFTWLTMGLAFIFCILVALFYHKIIVMFNSRRSLANTLGRCYSKR